MIRAVLFDMDGVLYDSMKNHAVAWVQSMKKFGITMTADDAYATEGARGVDTIRYMVKQQQGRDITEEESQLMYDEKTRIFHSMPEAPIMPGILSLMEQIHAAGITTGVVTGSGQRPLINRILRDFGKFVSIDNITTAYDVRRGKPNPDPYLMGLRKAGNLQPSEAMVVENAPLGIRAGVAAGIYTIAVNTGPLPDKVLLDAGANNLFPSMTALSDAWKDLPGDRYLADSSHVIPSVVEGSHIKGIALSVCPFLSAQKKRTKRKHHPPKALPQGRDATAPIRRSYK